MNNKQWIVSGPHILKNHKGEYGGEGWQVNRPHPFGGLSAREWVMDRELVKFFKTEDAAVNYCNRLNK